MLNKNFKTVAIVLFLFIMVIPFGCERGEDELVQVDKTMDENQGLLKSISLNSIYPAGMVAYWKFEEGAGTTTYDCVNNHVGTLINGPLWVAGVSGNGLLFNGVDAFVGVPHHPDFNPGEQFALEAWGYLYAPDDKTHDTFISKHGLSIPDNKFMSPYQFWVRNFDLAIDYNYGSGWIEFYGDLNSFELKQWNHVVFTKNQAELKLYYNGQLVKSELQFSDFPQSDGDLGIGANNGGWGSFNGIIDEVAIYNRALSDDEIQQHYQNGLNGLGYEDQVIQAVVEINPNILNSKSNGNWITVFIELPDNDVNDVDVNSISLSYNAQSVLADKASVLNNQLMVKFSTKEVIKILNEGDNVVTVNGNLLDGSGFTGTDIINLKYDQ